LLDFLCELYYDAQIHEHQADYYHYEKSLCSMDLVKEKEKSKTKFF